MAADPTSQLATALAAEADSRVIAGHASVPSDGRDPSRQALLQPLARAVLLTGFVLMSSCVIPTNLQEQTSSLDRPVIVTSLAQPPFGDIVLASSDTSNLTIAAEDESPSVKQLFARLFLPGKSAGTLAYTGAQITLIQIQGIDPNLKLFSGSFFSEPVLLCTDYPNNTEIYVVVGNLPFCVGPPPFPMDCPSDANVQPGGLTDQNHWTLQCE